MHIAFLKQKFLQLTVMGLLGAGLISLFVMQSQEMPIFALRFNPYAILSAVSLVTSLFLLIAMTRETIRSNEAVWLVFITGIVALFSFGEMMQRLSGDPASAVFWATLQGLVSGFIPVAVLLFALSYTRPESRHAATTAYLLIGSGVLIFFHAHTGLIWLSGADHIHSYPWGYNNEPGPGFGVNAFWIFSLVIWSLLALWRFRKHTKNKILRSQSRIYIWAFLTPLVGALLGDVGLPLVGVDIIPPLSVLFFTITAILLYIGMKRYEIFRVSPALISNEILEAMNESVVVINDQFEIELTNKEAEELLATESKALEHQPFLPFMHPASAATLKEKLLRVHSHTNTLINDLTITSNGQDVYVRISATKVTKENGLDGYILVINDVTELKNSYDALEREKSNVEHTVQVRTHELREAQSHLIEADKMKTEFVLLTSHNLRTPLAAIKGNLELLQLPNITNDQKVEILADLKGSSTKLGDLVEDLLTISTIEAGDAVVREPIPASDIFTTLLDDAQEMAAVSHNTFSSDLELENATIKGNAHQLQTALKNLLENAFKFTEEGEVTLSAVAKKKLVIIVSDTGIGISEDEIPKLFTKFHRATSTMRFNYEGEGIGLYLTKLIIEEHGGDIKVTSSEGHGTTFTITLPIVTDQPSHTETPDTPPPDTNEKPES